MRSESILRVLTAIKDYWFLVTLFVSAVASIVYMVVFQVNPWDKQRAIKRRKDRVRLHNLVGHTLLECGHYKLAKRQFQEALELIAVDQTALNGRFLAELFLEMDSPEWNPAVGLAIQKHLMESGMIERERRPHVIQMYLGKLHERIGKPDLAKSHYQRAVELKPEYPDALFTLGWFYYSEKPDLDAMEHAFRQMTKIDAYDYRGFHGLGYTLYMKAIREQDPKKRSGLMLDAARQSAAAKDLGVNRLNIVMDFGEVARSVNPQLSLHYHEWGARMLDDPVTSGAGDNPLNMLAVLLLSEGEVPLSGKEQKLAWIEFQLALDHLALYRTGHEPSGKQEHDHHLKKALELDPAKKIYPLYVDQSAILDLSVPDRP